MVQHSGCPINNQVAAGVSGWSSRAAPRRAGPNERGRGRADRPQCTPFQGRLPAAPASNCSDLQALQVHEDPQIVTPLSVQDGTVLEMGSFRINRTLSCLGSA